ncbi:MAG: arginase family protein, partial [Pseudomonadota bacterium]
RKFGLISHLRKLGLRISWGNTVNPPSDLGDAKQSAWEMHAHLCRHVAETLYQGDSYVVIGGDHSCAIGTWSGAGVSLKEKHPLGLIWIDVQLDSHTPEMASRGWLNQMSLAALLGHGEHRFTHLAGYCPIVHPEHVAVIGVRRYTPDEASCLEGLGVRVFSMDTVEKQGLEKVMYQALEIALHQTSGFGVSIDLTAIDSADAPAVTIPAEGGIRGKDLLHALRLIHMEPNFLGMEVAEYNPILDDDHRTARLTQDLIAAAFTGHSYEHGHKAGKQLLSA